MNVFAQNRFESEAKPILAKHCVSCHGGEKPSASFNLQRFDSQGQAISAPEVWRSVEKKVVSGEMPPEDKPRPTDAETARLLKWIRGLDSTKAPGQVTLRRLNRSEYLNTIRDLLLIDPGKLDEFPNDDVGYGFDTIGDVLTTSPLLLEKFLAAGDRFSSRAICVPGATEFAVTGRSMEPKKLLVNEGGKLLSEEGQVFVQHFFPLTGQYKITVQASGEQAGPEVCRAGLMIDDEKVWETDVPAIFPKSGSYTTTIAVRKGSHKLGVAFLNDYYAPNETDPKKRDRNLAVAGISVVFPDRFDGVSLPASHQTIVFKKLGPDENAREILRTFAGRAFRRPATDAEVERLMSFVKLAKTQGDPPERGIQMAVSACLSSPNFLFRPEIDARPDDGVRRPLGGYELASRLSYFLWSSMPDDELFAEAESGSLLEPAVLKRQTARLLADNRSRSLVDDFAAQWLTLRSLEGVTPDRKKFPIWNANLRRDMQGETAAFFLNLIKEDASVLELLRAKYTFVNERLAKFYGLSGVRGEKFQKVSLEGTPRSGVLTQAGILTLTSNPARTSPVKRGKWLLEQILGTPTPPPPPDVGSIQEDEKASQPKTIRLRLEQHRKNPSCAACHSRIDPLGFGLENFDAIGRFRETVDGTPVDSSGVLPGGKSFQGPEELAAIILENKKLFVRNLAEKMFIFALGRGTVPSDDAVLNRIAEEAASADYRFSALVTAIVLSEPFRFRGSLKAN